MLTIFGRSITLPVSLVAITFVALAAASCSPAQAAAEAVPANAIKVTANATNVLQEITFAGTYTDNDVEYLRESLQLLLDEMPTWAQYVEEAKPLVVAVDLTEGAHGRAAIAKCCLASNRGQIIFGDHLGALTDSSDPGSQSEEARRITFLATLAHEVTHVRDQRAGRFLSKTDLKTCIGAERSGLEKQLQFQQDALTVELGDTPISIGLYRSRLEQNVRTEAAALASPHLWDQYCGAFSS